MSEQEINEAIAKACGRQRNPDGGWYPDNGLRVGTQAIPDYCGDLNAMHEAENVLDETQAKCYEAMLVEYGFHATARQRAEAFLRAIPIGLLLDVAGHSTPTRRGVSADAGQMGGGAVMSDELEQLRQALHDARIENSGQAAELERLRDAFTTRDAGIQQTLGKALGYPWFKDDQKNFPGSTVEHGVCVGDHVAESLADEAAETIGRLRAERRWIPVKERLPWKGHCILALDERSVINITFRMDDQWAGVNPNIAITHWMPLPEPPKKEVQG